MNRLAGIRIVTANQLWFDPEPAFIRDTAIAATEEAAGTYCEEYLPI
jgi:hypothetical protein